MAYSVDLRKRVVEFVRSGGSKAEASRRFKVSRWCVFDWLQREDLTPRRPLEGHNRRMDWDELKRNVSDFPDWPLKRRARLFKASPSAICMALRKMGITVKKKTFKYKERDPARRASWLGELRRKLCENKNLTRVYVDECGFELESVRSRGWAESGKRVYGERSGGKRERVNLIAAKIGRELVAPLLFEGSANADLVNTWLTACLFDKLPKDSLVIMDNASFHKKRETRELFENSPHELLFLPSYSPDLNPIEKVFAILKKRREYDEGRTKLFDIIKAYGSEIN